MGQAQTRPRDLLVSSSVQSELFRSPLQGVVSEVSRPQVTRFLSPHPTPRNQVTGVMGVHLTSQQAWSGTSGHGCIFGFQR